MQKEIGVPCRPVCVRIYMGYLLCKLLKMGSLFSHVDSVDKLLMFIGFLGCLGDSLATSLTMYVLSGALNSFGTTDQSIAKAVVNKVHMF